MVIILRSLNSLEPDQYIFMDIVLEGSHWKVSVPRSVLKIRVVDWVIGFDEEEIHDNLQIKKDFLDFDTAGKYSSYKK